MLLGVVVIAGLAGVLSYGCGGDSGGTRPVAVTYSFADVWWEDEVDPNGNGCPTSATLVWDADVSGSNSKSVMAEVYYRLEGGSTWTLLGTTSCYTITGDSGTDLYGIEVVGADTGSYEFLIELYECGGTTVLEDVGPTTDSDLNNQCFQALCDDPAYALYDAWWTNLVDADADGYRESGRLTWDADVSNGCTKSVFARIYYRLEGSTSWSLLYTTSCYTITGTQTSDAYYVQLSGLATGCYEFNVDLFECGGASVVADLYPVDDPNLAAQCFEPVAQTYSIYDAWWTNVVDADANGYRESGRLTWDADVSTGSSSVFARVYYRTEGSSTWYLLSTTNCYTITGASSTDTYYVSITSGATTCYEFSIDILVCGGSTVVADWYPTDDAELDNECFEP